jgi:hypothetical protein
MSTKEFQGHAVIAEPRSSGYHFAARAASELDEIEKRQLINYLLADVSDETQVEVMTLAADLAGLKIASFGVEDITEQSAAMGDPLVEYEVNEVATSEAWANFPKALNAVGLEALRAVIVSVYPPEPIKDAPQGEPWSENCRHCGTEIKPAAEGDYESVADGGDVCAAATGELEPGGCEVITHKP